jgi:hypothetical protein
VKAAPDPDDVGRRRSRRSHAARDVVVEDREPVPPSDCALQALGELVHFVSDHGVERQHQVV